MFILENEGPICEQEQALSLAMAGREWVGGGQLGLRAVEGHRLNTPRAPPTGIFPFSFLFPSRWARMALNLWSSCLPLPNAGIPGR